MSNVLKAYNEWCESINASEDWWSLHESIASDAFKAGYAAGLKNAAPAQEGSHQGLVLTDEERDDLEKASWKVGSFEATFANILLRLSET